MLMPVPMLGAVSCHAMPCIRTRHNTTIHSFIPAFCLVFRSRTGIIVADFGTVLVSCMQITLSRTLEGINVDDIGYQPPLPLEEMNPGDFHPMREAALIASS
mmetsp:Transcript_4382/g.9977  ORF Transcript_4382/g.9977 Transcript_4382/m.9977 type:complete len:102 (+) Transcript_4382:557-862(+)